MKLNQLEVQLIKNEINIITNNVDILNKENYVDIPLDELNSINDYFSKDIKQNSVVNWVNEYINKEEEREKISIEKIRKIYNDENGGSISKTKMYNIFKNKLNLSYLKTSVKNPKIISPNYIFSCMCFIKIIARAINLGFKIYYMDESSILLKNNNFRCWRKSKEYIYHYSTIKKRSNLLLIFDENSIIYYKINKDPTNEKTFLVFMNEFLKSQNANTKTKYLMVLDNLAAHKTAKVKTFFNENKINIIYNTPYVNMFNCVELAFRYLKRHLYKNLYASLDNAEKDVKKLLESDNISSTLRKNYRETLNIYLSYFTEHKYKNLNNLNYEI